MVARSMATPKAKDVAVQLSSRSSITPGRRIPYSARPLVRACRIINTRDELQTMYVCPMPDHFTISLVRSMRSMGEREVNRETRMLKQ